AAASAVHPGLAYARARSTHAGRRLRPHHAKHRRGRAMTTELGPTSLTIDEAAEVDRISARIRSYLAAARHKGIVVAVSGGIDSSVVAALSVRALGPERVFALHLPE